MTLQVRIKDDFKADALRAFQTVVGGEVVKPEYVKGEWRDVPEGINSIGQRLEDEALTYPYFEVREKPVWEATASAIELADREGIDLEKVEGTGAGGRITKADVERLLSLRVRESLSISEEVQEEN